MCKVTWCLNSIEEGAHFATKYCKIHRQYKTYGKNAPEDHGYSIRLKR